MQQTSPLRNIPILQEHNFKSNSYATIPGDFLPRTKFSTTRFRVKNIKEKAPAVDNVNPVKYFCEKELALNLSNSPRSSPKMFKNHSFMSPTFSSEQKNKMREIKTITKLISPTRRGRSESPKANIGGSPERSPAVVKKVPYIDKSSSSLFHGMGDNIYELNLKSPKSVSILFYG